MNILYMSDQISFTSESSVTNITKSIFITNARTLVTSSMVIPDVCVKEDNTIKLTVAFVTVNHRVTCQETRVAMLLAGAK